jgi:hypothetical protein
MENFTTKGTEGKTQRSQSLICHFFFVLSFVSNIQALNDGMILVTNQDLFPTHLSSFFYG